ncbi:RTA1 domain protein [Aspergillus heteromorphus CBS 117.55]|uniref:RTA1 domain protein n=1 Tax=Aspergillus heteromorphus CBS 117.55 TaxID=1448321 RepID=A0A317UYP5_9EURO|nr:RTA1 domain protein [Aspergillus heteromorphus CBS 117.55]PWY66716.1 RTA1 domain protein [Aspergillus heteromorphus CBS 117.55]
MGLKSKCDLSSPNAQYDYCASGPAAILFSVLFGITMIAHLTQAIIYRKRFCWVIVMGTAWECLGLIMRTYSTINQVESNTASAGQLLVLLAPLWVNAYGYMIFGRMVYYYLPDRKIAGFRAEKLAKVFIWLDVTSFIVQATGGIMDSDFSNEMDTIGLHVYTAGIAMQEFFILCFCGLLVTFHRRMQGGGGNAERGTEWKTLAIAMYATLGCITIRIIYRLAEYADTNTAGTSILTTKEAFFYCLECVPIFSAMVIWNIWHPGRLMRGPESEFPKKIKISRKERKRMKREEKAQRKNGGKNGNYENPLTQSSDEAMLGEGRGEWPLDRMDDVETGYVR